MSEPMSYDPHAPDALARMVEQSAVRDMQAALAEAGLLADDWAEAARNRLQKVQDAADRAVLAFVESHEARIDDYIAGALWLMREHPRKFVAGAARVACHHPLAFVKALVKEMR